MMKVALYARVSTSDKDQNPEVQLDKLRQYCQDIGWEIFKEYIDHASAADLAGRKEWTRMMKDASMRKFHVLLVWKLDRAFRSMVHASNTLVMLKGYRVDFRSYMEPAIDTTTPYGELLFNILAAFAGFERDMISQRVIAGMDYAKAHGTKSGEPIGRKGLPIDFTDICKAVTDTKNDSSPKWSDAARLLTDRTGIEISPGFCQIRIKREADNRGLSYDDLLAEIIEGGQ